MTTPQTLFELAGADLTPPLLSEACLVLIDMQNEYLSGPLALTGAAEAISSAQQLLGKARSAGSDVIHVAHHGSKGSLFDRSAERGQIIEGLTPIHHEPVVEKGLPNSFAGTNLQALLTEKGCTDIILAGFMTHMCVSTTARAALDLGFRVTVDAPSCATRDLPDGRGGIVAAQTIHDVALVELSDRFAIITREYDWK